MTTARNPSRPCSPRPAYRRDGGSLLVLVVVALVLMALLGAAYLQVARVDRFATADQRQSNIDQVANATINYIAKALRDDLVDSNGNFFGPATSTIPSRYAAGTGDEPLDYPWTNTNPAYQGQWYVKLDDGTDTALSPGTGADGGIDDDTWLASTIPTFAGTAATWGHLTNLMGTYLQLPSATSLTLVPTELPTVATDLNDWNSDTGVAISNTAPFTDGVNSLDTATTADFLPLGVDTDLDGIPDAKWQWAPLRQIGSVKYVMAVRIIDNSSLININTSTAMSSDGDTISGARGYYPSEIDLSRIVKRVDPANWQSELALDTSSLFQLRGLATNATPSSVLPTPLGTLTVMSDGSINWPAGVTTRSGAWFNNLRLWGDRTNKLLMTNEIELRRLGGVNNDRVTTPVESAMSNLLRETSTETLYNSLPAMAGYPTDRERRLTYFQGTESADRTISTAPVANRDFPSLRNQVTTHSAAAIFASNPGSVNVTSGIAQRKLKYDLINADGGNTDNNAVRARAIRDRLYNIFRISDSGMSGGANAYLGINTTVAGANTLLSDIATEYALAIQAYTDPGSTPTPSNVLTTITPTYSTFNSRVYYSLETLPFFREVYIQAVYQNQDLLDGTGNPGTNGLPDTLIYTPDSAAIAFEIGNPFDRTIDFTAADGPNVRVRVAGNLFPITGTIDPRAVRIFEASRASTLRPEGTDTNNRGNLVTDLNLGAMTNVTNLAVDPALTPDTAITFELQVEVPKGSGTWVTYDRLGDATMSFPSAKATHYPAESPAANLNTYNHDIQTIVRPCTPAAAGTPDIYYISNAGKTPVPIPAVPGNNTFPANPARFNQDDKGVYTVDADLQGFQIPLANRQLASVSELGMILTFGFYSNASNPADDAIGDFPTRIATIGSGEWFIQLDTTTMPAYTNATMPHGTLVFEQFTTLSPRNDGEDNDLDGNIDNEAEQVVMGQININTAPLHILTLAAPLNESITEIEALMQSIIAYRDNPGLRGSYSTSGVAPRPASPGVANMGELMLLNNTTAFPTAQERMDGYTAIAPGTFSASSLDLYPFPEEVAPPNVIRVAGLDQAGREQQLARFQFLSQVFNTRSDVYTAFVRLRGYPAQDFTKGEVESRNFLVVFDRSNIISADDMPRILGVYVYNVP